MVGRKAPPYPVIALVNNGSHWVTVVAYDNADGYYVHNNWTGEWWSNLDLSFHGPPSWASLGLGDSKGCKEGTILTIESKAAEGRIVDPSWNPLHKQPKMLLQIPRWNLPYLCAKWSIMSRSRGQRSRL